MLRHTEFKCCSPWLQETVGCAQALYMLSNGMLPLWAGAGGRAWRSQQGCMLTTGQTAARQSAAIYLVLHTAPAPQPRVVAPAELHRHTPCSSSPRAPLPLLQTAGCIVVSCSAFVLLLLERRGARWLEALFGVVIGVEAVSEVAH